MASPNEIDACDVNTECVIDLPVAVFTTRRGNAGFAEGRHGNVLQNWQPHTDLMTRDHDPQTPVRNPLAAKSELQPLPDLASWLQEGFELHRQGQVTVKEPIVRASIIPAIKGHEDTSDCWNQAIFGEMIPCLIRALIQRGAFFLTLIAS